MPATPEFVSLARLVVSSIADHRYEITEGRLDDLKLAVSEACVLAIEAETGPQASFSVTCEGTSEDLSVVVAHTDNAEPEGVADKIGVSSFEEFRPASLGLPLIHSLVDEVGLESERGLSSLRMTLRCRALEFS